jgi:hypothetical protein
MHYYASLGKLATQLCLVFKEGPCEDSLVTELLPVSTCL